MGHHNKKATQTAPAPVPSPPFDINSVGQLLNNVDINSMSSMLSKMDINQIISILSKAFTPSANTQSNNEAGNIGSISPNTYSTLNNTSGNTSNEASKSEPFNPLKAFNIPYFNLPNKPVQTPLSPILPPNDPTVMILNSLKPFLPSDKCIIVDNMIQIYGIKTVIDKIFPPSAQVNSFNEKNSSDDIKSEDQSNNKTETME